MNYKLWILVFRFFILHLEQENKFAHTQIPGNTADVWRLHYQKYGVPGASSDSQMPDDAADVCRQAASKVRCGSGWIFTHRFDRPVLILDTFQEIEKMNKIDITVINFDPTQRNFFRRLNRAWKNYVIQIGIIIFFFHNFVTIFWTSNRGTAVNSL